jgi:uncharacterized RmlC-like cupin family protein
MTPHPVVLSAEDIAALPEQPFDAIEGVTHRVVWSNADSMAGIMTIERGRHLGAHAHHANHHHIWILRGEAVILGERLAEGAYVHIPSGVDHDIDATDTAGCTVLYLYIRHAD